MCAPAPRPPDSPTDSAEPSCSSSERRSLRSPLYLTALCVGPPSDTYRTTPVHVEGGEIVVEGVDDGDRVSGCIAGIDCTADGYYEGRACALAGTAMPRFDLTWPGRVALFTGGVTTTYPLTHAEHVVETANGYRLVYLASFDSAGGGGQSVFYLFGIVVGVWLLVRGYRRLPAGDERSESR